MTTHRRLLLGASAAGLAVLLVAVSLPRLSNLVGQELPSSPTATGTDEPPPRGRLVWFEEIRLADDGRTVHLSFTGGPEYSPLDPCSEDYGATAEVVDDVLEVAVFELLRPKRPLAPMEECPALGYPREIAVELAESFLSHTVRDLAGYVHFVGRPDGLVDFELPAGWELREERSIGSSPSGRYRRSYSPNVDLGAGGHPGRLDIYQAFGAPASVSGTYPLPPVRVNGEPAQLWNWPEVGELVLSWRFEGHGLALVASEQDFSVEELIALAESAKLPSDEASPQPRPTTSPCPRGCPTFGDGWVEVSRGSSTSVEWSRDGVHRIVVEARRITLLRQSDGAVVRAYEPGDGGGTYSRAYWIDEEQFLLVLSRPSLAPDGVSALIETQLGSVGSDGLRPVDVPRERSRREVASPLGLPSGRGAIAFFDTDRSREECAGRHCESFTIWTPEGTSAQRDGIPVAWSPDGRRLAVIHRGISVDGSGAGIPWFFGWLEVISWPELDVLFAGEHILTEEVHTGFDPSGRYVAYMHRQNGILDLETGRSVMVDGEWIDAPVWDSDGRLIVRLADGDIAALGVDGEERERWGDLGSYLTGVPDGSAVLVARWPEEGRPDGAFTVLRNGSMYELPWPPYTTTGFNPTWLTPDGASIVVRVRNGHSTVMHPLEEDIERPGPGAKQVIECGRHDADSCQAAIQVVADQDPAAVTSAGAVVVDDTCDPRVYCDRFYPFSSLVVLVPSPGAGKFTTFHVVGLDYWPEQLVEWDWPVPNHVLELIHALEDDST